ncbi:unnamed protein product [Pieris macdunnoughi]|uniref:Transposase n=1 Tax=Pieris macdunnoughi TaxID=345717 RepID=A0A821UEQ8_9NEOP|nr:unnamed protein product [Pieris macdunnoughi]
MPRVPLYSPDDVYSRLKNLQFRDETNKYLPYNDEVWRRAVKLLPGITIHLTASEWKKLNLKTKTFKDNREYEVFEPGWTDKIYSYVWHHFKLSCPFSFQTPKISRGSDIFLSINGACDECKNEIHLYSLEDASDDGIDFHVSTCDTKHIKHVKKRQLRGNTRKEVINELNGKSTYMWRRQKADEKMEFGDDEPADLPKESVLRNAKYTKNRKDLGLESFSHHILAVENLKTNPKYSEALHEIAFNKMYVMYWLPEQISLYKLFMQKDPIKEIKIDATGSLIQCLSANDNSKRVILYYQVIATYQKSSLPLLQLVSEKHDANTLSYWLREWLRCGINAPKQVVTDFSLALLNAATLAFNNMPLSQYIDECYKSVVDGTLIEKTTILRIDVAHLCKFVSMWPCFNKNNRH